MLSHRAGTREGSIRIALAAGGCLVFVSAFLPWFDGGNGFATAERLLALAEIGVPADLPPRWVLASWYLIPAGGALLAGAALLAGRRTLALLAIGTVAIGAVVCVSVLGVAGPDSLGPLACLAGLTLTAACMVALLATAQS